MKKIEKILSRDMTVIDMQAWRISLTSGLQNCLGWSYSDLIFYYHDNYSDIILATEEHYGGFLDYIIKKIKQDPGWFKSEYKKFLEVTSEFDIFFNNSNQYLSKEVSDNDMVRIYNEYCDFMSRNFGPFVVMKWLPIWLEKDSALSLTYKDEIDLAIDARKKSEQMLPQGRALCSLLIKKLSEKSGIDINLVNFVDRLEFLNYFETGLALDTEKLTQRKFGFILSNSGVALTSGDSKKAKNILADLGYDLEVNLLDDVVEVKGQTAFKGIVSGIAHLIMTKNEIKDIKEGEILITSMTTPEYLSAMKKSAAFVTDEGGITCHAAIVAREMGKPCVIGTKISTRVFKTGDLLEVDANNGVIKKIKQIN